LQPFADGRIAIWLSACVADPPTPPYARRRADAPDNHSIKSGAYCAARDEVGGLCGVYHRPSIARTVG